MRPVGYDAWIRYVFDRPTTPRGWCFDLDDVVTFDATPAELVAYIAATVEHCRTDLARFTDAQVADGVRYIFSNSCSNVVFALKRREVPFDTRRRAIEGIRELYRGCFGPRCVESGAAEADEGVKRLNAACFMFWDVTPIAGWVDPPGERDMYEAVLDVLEDALTSANPVCVDSGLHGLGHVRLSAGVRVEAIVDAYLARHPDLPPARREYALAARCGLVM